MKLAITAKTENRNDAVDPRFGRCRYFIIIDTETDETEVINNTMNVNAAQGAGIQSAQNLINSGAEAIVTGHVGPKAFRTLSAGGIKIFTGAQGTIEDALKAWKENKLEKASQADVEGHWI